MKIFVPINNMLYKLLLNNSLKFTQQSPEADIQGTLLLLKSSS